MFIYRLKQSLEACVLLSKISTEVLFAILLQRFFYAICDSLSSRLHYSQTRKAYSFRNGAKTESDISIGT